MTITVTYPEEKNILAVDKDNNKIVKSKSEEIKIFDKSKLVDYFSNYFSNANEIVPDDFDCNVLYYRLQVMKPTYIVENKKRT